MPNKMLPGYSPTNQPFLQRNADIRQLASVNDMDAHHYGGIPDQQGGGLLSALGGAAGGAAAAMMVPGAGPLLAGITMAGQFGVDMYDKYNKRARRARRQRERDRAKLAAQQMDVNDRLYARQYGGGAGSVYQRGSGSMTGAGSLLAQRQQTQRPKINLAQLVQQAKGTA